MRKEVRVVSELEEFYKRAEKAIKSNVMRMLKKSDPEVLKLFVCDQLIKSGSTLFEKAMPNGEDFHIALRCWKKGLFGMRSLRSLLGAGEGHSYRFVIVVTTSGVTRQVENFAQKFSKPIYFFHLEELIRIYLLRNAYYL